MMVQLKSGRERSVLNRHPWIFSGSVESEDGSCKPGELVEVYDSEKHLLGFGFYNPNSDIRVRMWRFAEEKEEAFGETFRRRLLSAIELRTALIDLKKTNAFRLVNSSGDRLDGLIIDYYAGHLVIEPLSACVEAKFSEVFQLLAEIVSSRLDLQSVRLRVEPEAARLEGLTLKTGPWPAGSELPAVVPIRELGLAYEVDLERGQKTGFFLDQRENRNITRTLSKNARVLNLFAYTGGFTVNALVGGAREVVSVDSSAPALQLLERNLAHNGLKELNRSITHNVDVKSFLPDAEKKGERFDLVICDPPPFARSRAHVERAARAYKDINRRAIALIDKGWFLTFSCSPFVDAKLFRQIVFSAAVEASKNARVLRPLGPGEDHPVHLFHPEGDYLNGLLLRIGE